MQSAGLSAQLAFNKCSGNPHQLGRFLFKCMHATVDGTVKTEETLFYVIFFIMARAPLPLLSISPSLVDCAPKAAEIYKINVGEKTGILFLLNCRELL